MNILTQVQVPRPFYYGGLKIWFERKNAQFTNVLHFLGILFNFLCWFLANYVCANLLHRNIARAKKFAFRKYEDQSLSYSINESVTNLFVGQP